MNNHVIEQTEDWRRCCIIIDKLVDIGDCDILGDCIRMCCANSEEVMDCVIGQYEDIYDDD